MKKIITIVGILLLIALIWIAGGYVGLQSSGKLYLTIGIIVIVGGIMLWKILQATRVSSFIENLIKRQADDQLINARPDQKENIEAIKNQFFESIKVLKKSKVGKGLRGASALYELPWYVILGPPATGKSTLLRHSGLNFPLTDKKIQGVGGTRNCDWWFANDGIILDTAGRYTTEGEDKDEWLVFLDILKKNRKRQPINGVMIAVSVEDLMNWSDEEIEKCAEKVKDRCDELLDKLEVKFPIYLMFTKCDLMDGFVDFFGDLTKNEREQVWGCTLTDEQRNESDLSQVFRNELDRLSKSLYSWRLDKLSKERKLEKRERIFLFPLQFANVHKKITRFASYLFQPNPYRENPVLRGFYFTCGTQEGSPIDKIIGRINPAFEDIEKKSYFIKDCFTKIMFPDQNFAQLTASAKRTHNFTLIGSIAASVLLLLGGVFSLSASYMNNSKLANEIHSHAKQVSEINWNRGLTLKENLTNLDRLREDIILLEKYETEGPPLKLRFGLYKGEEFINISRKIYLTKLDEIMITPLKREIEQAITLRMDNPVAEWNLLYDALKTYLMFTRPDELNKEFLNDRANKFWHNYLSKAFGEQLNPSIEKIMPQHIAFYIDQLNTLEEKYVITPNNNLTKQARILLTKEPAVNSVYSGIKKIAANKLPPIRLEEILPAESRGTLVSNYTIPGMFTKHGYNSFIKEAILKGGNISGTGDWVLGSNIQVDENTKEKQKILIAKLNNLYIEEYIGTWKEFVQSIDVKAFKTIDEMVKKLNLLSNEQSSPLVLIFRKIAENMQVKISSEKEEVIKGEKEFFDDIKGKIGLGKKQAANQTKALENVLEKEFKKLSLFTGFEEKDEAKLPGLFKYLETLRQLHEKLYALTLTAALGNEVKIFTQKLFVKSTYLGGTNELISGLQKTNYITSDLKSSLKGPIKRVFLQVFDQVGAMVIQATAEELNQRWKEKVFKTYKAQIYGRYPFAQDASEEISRRDAAEFFKPNEGLIWQFYDKELKFFLTKENHKFTPKKWQGKSIAFSKDFLKSYGRASKISEVLFWQDKRMPKVKFWIRPHPPKSATTSISRTVFYINGQKLVYENGPEVWEPFAWPGTLLEKEGLSPQTSLEISRGITGSKAEKNLDGEWSLFRLLNEANITTENNQFFKLYWKFQYEGEPVTVYADIKTESAKNPFIPRVFSNFTCPDQLASFD